MVRKQNERGEADVSGEMKSRAKEVLSALCFLHANRYANRGQAEGDPCCISTAPDMQLSQMIWKTREASDVTGEHNNIQREAFNEVCDDFLKVSSLVLRIRELEPLRTVLRVEELIPVLPMRAEALDGLSVDEVLREFEWRLAQLACHLYSLPKIVH